MSLPRAQRAVVPGDPAAERRLHDRRRRVAESLFRGAGTVWGLGAAAADVEKNGHRTRVLVRPGMAIDALGRELCVDREQCLDVDTLVQHPIWRELSPPDGGSSPTARRAYIVLRHDDTHVAPRQATVSSGARQGASGAGLSEPPRPPAPVPPPEQFRIELCPAPPPDPTALRKRALTAFGGAEAGLRGDEGTRLDFWLQESHPASTPLPAGPDAAPLLLAILDLEVAGTMAYIVPGTLAAPNPDNRSRAVLPGPRAVAECLFGRRLSSG